MNKFKFITSIYIILFTLLIPKSSEALTHVCLDSVQVILHQADLLRLRGQNLLASAQYLSATALSCSSQEKYAAKLGYALCMIELHETAEALQTLTDLRADKNLTSSLQKIADEALGWLAPELRSNLNPELQSKFEIWQHRYDLGWLKSNLNMGYSGVESPILKLVEKTQFAPAKNPWISGVASAVVPGLGQVYNGNYQSAAFSFAINALFLSTALELQQKGLYAASNAAAAVFSVTYVGGILSSVQASQAINQHQLAPYDQELRKTLFTF